MESIVFIFERFLNFRKVSKFGEIIRNFIIRNKTTGEDGTAPPFALTGIDLTAPEAVDPYLLSSDSEDGAASDGTHLSRGLCTKHGLSA